jgi:sensor histidine kinase YesM
MNNKETLSLHKNESSLLNFVMNKKWSWLRHFILILIIGLNFSLLNIDGLKRFALHVNVPFKVILIGNAAMAFWALIIIYINLYIIFPVFFKQGKYLYYAICIIALVVFFFLVIYTIQQINVKYYGKDAKDAISLSVFGFIETVMYPLVFLASTTGYRLFKIWIVDQKKFAALEKSQLNTELTQLKNQVNPHFLFNTLNNLEVLTKTNPEKASQIILGLSDVLRYQIYDSQNETVLLSKDIEIIQQYIELEKIRRDHLITSIKIEGNTNGIIIPPLLFINFVDNAIKHSNSRGGSFIHILFKVIENEVDFTIINSTSTLTPDEKNSGLGLVNITKRLQLLFGDKHSLKIKENGNQFEVHLKFPV